MNLIKNSLYLFVFGLHLSIPSEIYPKKQKKIKQDVTQEIPAKKQYDKPKLFDILSQACPVDSVDTYYVPLREIIINIKNTSWQRPLKNTMSYACEQELSPWKTKTIFSLSYGASQNNVSNQIISNMILALNGNIISMKRYLEFATLWKQVLSFSLNKDSILQLMKFSIDTKLHPSATEALISFYLQQKQWDMNDKKAIKLASKMIQKYSKLSNPYLKKKLQDYLTDLDKEDVKIYPHLIDKYVASKDISAFLQTYKD